MLHSAVSVYWGCHFLLVQHKLIVFCTLQNITNFDGAKLQPLQEVTARPDLKMVLHTKWNNHPYTIKRNLQAKLGLCQKGFQFREDGYLECSSGDAKQVMPCILSRCYIRQMCYRRDKAPCRRSDILATLYVLEQNHTTIIEDQGTKWFPPDEQEI